jgi:hypothetical protein
MKGNKNISSQKRKTIDIWLPKSKIRAKDDKKEKKAQNNR